MMADGPRLPNESGRGSDLRRAAEYLWVQLCDCLWEFTPTWLALRWLRWRLERLWKREAALRAAANGERTTARWQALEAAYEALDYRRASLHGRNRTWLEQFLRAVMIIHLLNGIVISFLRWLWAVEKVQQAFSLAVAVEL